MAHYTLGPIEEAFGNSIQADIPAPESNNDFLWGIAATLVVASIIYLIVSKNKIQTI